MSRIPVPSSNQSHTPTRSNTNSKGPVSFPPDRALSPNPLSAPMSSVAGSLSEGRKKQSRKDEAIRKKIEADLGRKRTISAAYPSSRHRAGGKPAVTKGTVAALRPSPALTVRDNFTVAEASQLCAAKRTDCVLVTDDDEGLSGILTAKDLAYRVTAEGLDPHTTTVGSIMTKNPMTTSDSSSATEALQLMVRKHFRHLPVVNEDENVVGILDITKVFHEALGKVERSSAASQKLSEALAGLHTEMGSMNDPRAAVLNAYAETLRNRTELPDLTTVMDSRTTPAVVAPKTTVRQVAMLMREKRTTAVCVMEPPQVTGLPPRIAGIFTSKDIVLRVIAAGLDPNICSVVRVMTPHPDTAPPTMTIHDALKRMHNGHYLNLPVLEGDGRLVAIVDVLKLTYATLEQMDQMAAAQSSDDNAAPQGGGMIDYFFESLGQHEDGESVLSGSQALTNPSTPAFQRNLSRVQQSPQSEVHPNDSASVVDDDASDLHEIRRGGRGPAGAEKASAIVQDDGTYVFKFRTPSGATHRFQARHDNVENLRDIITLKLETDIFFTLPPAGKELDHREFALSYTDADGDNVVITTDHDVTDAVKIARKAGADRVVLTIQGPKEWAEAEADKIRVKAEDPVIPPKVASKEVDKTEVRLPEAATMTTPDKPTTHVIPNDTIMGIPKDMLLPASIGALAVVIVGVFTISRITRDY